MNSGVNVLGDFNKVNITRLKHNFELKQIAHFPTCGQSKLDLISTNLKFFYDAPTMLPLFSLSDHVAIKVLPLN